MNNGQINSLFLTLNFNRNDKLIGNLQQQPLKYGNCSHLCSVTKTIRKYQHLMIHFSGAVCSVEILYKSI